MSHFYFTRPSGCLWAHCCTYIFTSYITSYIWFAAVVCELMVYCLCVCRTAPATGDSTIIHRYGMCVCACVRVCVCMCMCVCVRACMHVWWTSAWKSVKISSASGVVKQASVCTSLQSPSSSLYHCSIPPNVDSWTSTINCGLTECIALIVASRDILDL